MKKHIQYLKYILKHKLYVAIECFKVGLFWRGITHDLSKFLPSEWFPYVEYFYGDPKSNNPFNRAWLEHQHRNNHHHQFWTLREDDGGNVLIPMDPKALLEMVCDWKGAGKAQGFPDTKAWYLKNMHKIALLPTDRVRVEELLDLPPREDRKFWDNIGTDITHCG